MNRLLGLAAGALIALGAPVVTSAAPVTYTDIVPGSHTCISADAPAACNGTGGATSVGSTQFTFDITDDGFVPGSLITSAEITLDLSDDGGSGDGSEKITLSLDGSSLTYTDNANHQAVITLSDFTLLADGKILVVVLGASTGDYFFDGAKLTVVDDPDAGSETSAAAVPAPAALLILGAGALAAACRRRVAR